MRRLVLESASSEVIVVQGKPYLYFGGTNYLGMSNRTEVLSAAKRAIDSFGLSSGASRTSTGTNELHLKVEAALSTFAGTEDAVVLSSGYLAMQCLLEGVVEKKDLLFLQSSAHPSIRQAVLLTGFPFQQFEPDRLENLRPLLQGGRRVIVVAEGITSLTGEPFPLPELLSILGDHCFRILIDDAHGLGVVGATGRGTAEFHHCDSANILTCATLSKAFGAFGGCVLSPEDVGESIRQRSMAYICATPPSAPDLGAALAAIELVMNHPDIVHQLHRNVAQLKKGLKHLGLPVAENPIPIIPIRLGSSREMSELCDRLFESGILVPHLTYPGSPEGGLIRVAVSAAHTPEQIERLLGCIRRELR